MIKYSNSKIHKIFRYIKNNVAYSGKFTVEKKKDLTWVQACLLEQFLAFWHRLHFAFRDLLQDTPADGSLVDRLEILLRQSPRHRPGSGAWVFQRGACRSRSVRPGRSRSDRPAARCRRHTGNTEGANSCRDQPDWQTQLCLHRRSVCHTGKINLVGVVQREGS